MGGLVGLNLGPEILNSFATGSVSQIDGELQGGIGGLIGFNSGGLVQNSYATGAVAAASAPDVGGLIGYNDDGTISGSHSTGVVTGGDQDVGGLVGASIGGSSEIETSYSTSSVTASLGTQVGQESTDVGGLVGENQGMIQRSYATGSATGNDVVGGLVGVNDIGAIIKLSYASGAATATANPAVVGDGTDAGGLVGSASGTLSYDYALGNVSGYDDVGGLIGSAASGLTVKQAYSTGVSSASNPSPIALGASIGLNNGATLTDVYWDSTNNPTLAGVGSGANGTSSLTTAQLTSGLPTGFTASIWGSSPSVNDGLPYLLALPPA
jgi:hypothetical protein